MRSDFSLSSIWYFLPLIWSVHIQNELNFLTVRLGDSSSWEIPPFSQQQMGFVYQVAAKVRISTSLHFSADVFGVVKKSLNASMITLLSIPRQGGEMSKRSGRNTSFNMPTLHQ